MSPRDAQLLQLPRALLPTEDRGALGEGLSSLCCCSSSHHGKELPCHCKGQTQLRACAPTAHPWEQGDNWHYQVPDQLLPSGMTWGRFPCATGLVPWLHAPPQPLPFPDTAREVMEGAALVPDALWGQPGLFHRSTTLTKR